MLPMEIRTSQREALYLFAQSIPDYTVRIAYDLSLEDEILIDRELRPMGKESAVQLLDSYFEKRVTKIK